MSIQEIQDYKLNWLRKKSFQVKGKVSELEERSEWLKLNLDERVWEVSVNYKLGTCAYYFESPQGAEKYREQFLGDSRTTDLGE